MISVVNKDEAQLIDDTKLAGSQLFSSPELPLELGFPSFALDSNSVGFPLNVSFLDFRAEIRLEIYQLLLMNHEHKCVWLDGDDEGSEGSEDSEDS